MRKALVLIAASFFVYGLFYFFFLEFTDVSILKKQYPVIIYKGKGQEPITKFQKNRPDSWVSLGEISKDAVRAIMISEDAAFYQHNGYDFDQLLEAMKENLRKRRFARGGSTITQQVAKNIFLDSDKNLWRKFRELILSLRMERQVGKKRILETYFNIAEWGEGIYGITPAARHYFHKHPSQLNAKEAAFLAMLLPSPKKYSVSFRKGELSSFARSTTKKILRKLFAVGQVTEAEYFQYIKTPYAFEKTFIQASEADSLEEPADEIFEEVEESGYEEVPLLSR